MSIVGPLIGGLEVERAALVVLREWLPTYLKEATDQAGLKPGLIEEVNSWMVLSEVDRWPEANLPAVIVAAPGLIKEPEKDGDGSYSVVWKLEVSVSIAAATGPAARKYAQVYAAAIRGLILQRRSLGDDMLATDWLDEAYGTSSQAEERTVAAAAVVFAVQHDNVVNWRKGKGLVPNKPVPANDPTVQEIDVDTEVQQ
ncbi:MAG TPA: hypothetical protein VN758_00580 [Solirubrobacterales bacterium]|nr:hypothetical protein [Solirubrobacterales bacterium]